MIGVAWFTCTLLVLVSARIYERCELVHELMELGINQGDISTWVCIAFHESRFNTAANNFHSGDHGIFQISELYWCGKGKACHLPCSDLKDDDITDDMECALRIHEEHTRLQGDGFLAWVVYPHHCKQNTKKYIADCDHQTKNSLKDTAKSQPRSFNTYYDSSFYDSNYTSGRDMTNKESLPAFLVISSLFRANYGKLDLNKNGNTDWLNYKIDNIDDLKLPVFGKSEVVTVPTTTLSITYAPVKPWRIIETNQFRYKNKSHEKSTVKPETTTTLASMTEPITHRATTITSLKPVLVASDHNNLPKVIRKPNDIHSATTNSVNSTKATYSFKPWTSTSTFKPLTTRTTKLSPFVYTTEKPTVSNKRTEIRPVTTFRPFTTVTVTTKTGKLLESTTTTTTTVRPLQTTAIRTTTERCLQMTTTTTKPFSTKSEPQTKSQTNRYGSRLSFPKSKTASTETKYYSFAPISTTTALPKLTTVSPIITTSRASTKSKDIAQFTRTTQSIFDLYLNPTKRPKYTPFDFSFFGNSHSKVIFSGGTTSAPTLKRSTRVL